MIRRIMFFLAVVLLLSSTSFAAIGQALEVEHPYVGTAAGLAPLLSGQTTYSYASYSTYQQEVYVDGQSYYPLIMPRRTNPSLLPSLTLSLKLSQPMISPNLSVPIISPMLVRPLALHPTHFLMTLRLRRPPVLAQSGPMIVYPQLPPAYTTSTFPISPTTQ